MSTWIGLALLALSSQVVAQGTPGRGFPDCENGPLKNNTVCDTSADPLTRAQALIREFTTAEKINNTGSVSPGVPRLGLPAINWWSEALHGVASSPGVNFSTSGNYSYATSFPQPILMGAAFDDDLIRRVATIVSTEARAFSNVQRAGLDFWTPNINPFRDPRWGRGQETPGEDPFHLSSYVHALIEGLEGTGLSKYKKVVATCKHFAGYDMETWNGNFRYQWDAQISQQDLKDYYTPSFQTCARDANVGAIMCTYNALNGVPTCADPWLLNDLLRDHWGFSREQGWVTSDCDSIQNIFEPHGYGATREEAAAKALVAGTDVNCGTYYQRHLPAAHEQGLINDTVLDQALVRQYSSLVRLGYFDGMAVPYRSLDFSDVNTAEAQQLAYRAAVEGITLLKNDGTLPVQISNDTSIVIVGGWANATEQMQGNYKGTAPYLRSPYDAAVATGATVTIHQVPGGQGDPTTNDWLNVWPDVGKSDIIIYAGGIDNSVESEGLDRVSVAWTGAQIDIIGELASYGKPMVVLQMGGGQIDSAPLVRNENISALLWGGYPGQDGGTALLDIITGKAAPAGRLPITQYPADYIARVPMTDMSLRPNASSGSPGRTYQWYDGKPATFEFGYGLHYTNFSASFGHSTAPSYGSDSGSSYSISDLISNCDEQYQDLCQLQSFDVDIQNTGSVTSDYSVLGFLTGAHGPQPYPKKRLVAYSKLHNITAGSSSTASLNLTLGSLSRADEMGNSVLYPGDYALMVDTQPLAMVNFTLTGEPTIIDHWPQPPAAQLQQSDYFVGGYGSTYGDEILINGNV